MTMDKDNGITCVESDTTHRRRQGLVPAEASSSSCDGLSRGCYAGPSEEPTTADLRVDAESEVIDLSYLVGSNLSGVKDIDTISVTSDMSTTSVASKRKLASSQSSTGSDTLTDGSEAGKLARKKKRQEAMLSLREGFRRRKERKKGSPPPSSSQEAFVFPEPAAPKSKKGNPPSSSSQEVFVFSAQNPKGRRKKKNGPGRPAKMSTRPMDFKRLKSPERFDAISNRDMTPNDVCAKGIETLEEMELLRCKSANFKAGLGGI